ncbi:dihydro-orotate oxidase, FMN-linked [Thiomonas sp. X19]|uniref:quinone-dependent dihydroorotate dehydrogenase n=1 Tax=Thiomonas sp. X19 TaxID=1050370 RepID=UPI000B66B5A4|nr:quinone-dependent dihydroorotate dehydrogenase [Thiomonas sp. X19]SCC92541.1 dihydro-orotate oxidase, FMN-linked [Thiomonas sp. X19]
MPLPYALMRPLLFSLDPEAAHDLTLRGLRLLHQTGLSRLYAHPRVHDPVQLLGLSFPNRIGLAAGLDKNGAAIDALAAMGFGFIEVGTVTPRAQPGNAKPRLFRLPQAQALINRMGFNNAGLDAFLHHVRRSRRELPLGLNIGKNASTPMEQALDDYAAGLRAVYAHADYVTINVSSPNTQGLRALQTDAALEALLTGLATEREQLAQAQGKRVPLMVKVAPDLQPEQIAALADALMRHGIDGVIATNTTIARDAVAGLPHADEAGGLSGAPLREQSTRVIAQLRARLGPGYPIIGVGGILQAGDAVKKIQAGANLVQLYTGLIYQGPELVSRCAQALGRMTKPH